MFLKMVVETNGMSYIAHRSYYKETSITDLPDQETSIELVSVLLSNWRFVSPHNSANKHRLNLIQKVKSTCSLHAAQKGFYHELDTCKIIKQKRTILPTRWYAWALLFYLNICNFEIRSYEFPFGSDYRSLEQCIRNTSKTDVFGAICCAVLDIWMF